MAIRRGKRPDTHFYTVNKEISEDTRLSWSARGMLIFLLGKPDNWQVSVAHLIKQTADSSRSTGRDGVRVIIKELIDAGYMMADGVRQDGGTFAGMNYVVNESPETDLPSPVKPQVKAQKSSAPKTGLPSPVQPSPVNPPLIKNDFKQGLKNPTKNESSDAEKSASATGDILVGEVLPKQEHSDQDNNKTNYDRIREVFWQRFDATYLARYHTTLPRNAKTNSQVKQLIQRLGKEAPAVAMFYVQNVNEQRVVMASHTLDFLLMNAEGYRTQWASGRSMTNTRARQLDQTAANFGAADEAKAMLREKRARERGENAE